MRCAAHLSPALVIRKQEGNSLAQRLRIIRVDQEAELNGLDVSELGMEAYPDFTKG